MNGMLVVGLLIWTETACCAQLAITLIVYNAIILIKYKATGIEQQAGGIRQRMMIDANII